MSLRYTIALKENLGIYKSMYFNKREKRDAMGLSNRVRGKEKEKRDT